MSSRKFNQVLLVDDDPGTNFLHKLYLEEWGMANHIYTVSQGKAALDFLSENPDFYASQDSLVLLDINMPVMDGFEFLEAFAELDDAKKESIVIIMLTSSLHPKDKERAEQFEFLRGFIRKPLTIDDMHHVFDALEAGTKTQS